MSTTPSYSIHINNNCAYCYIQVPAWVNEHVVRMILSEPTFLKDVKEAYEKFSALAKHYTDLVLSHTAETASKWASEYIPVTPPFFSIECDSSSADIVIKLPHGLPCVPFKTSGKGIIGVNDGYLTYDSYRNADTSNIVEIKPADTSGQNEESKTFMRDAQTIASLSRFLYPSKASSSYRTEALGPDEIPDATGRFVKVEHYEAVLGLFSPMKGKGGGISQEMQEEAERLCVRFMEKLEPLRIELDEFVKNSYVFEKESPAGTGEKNAEIS